MKKSIFLLFAVVSVAGMIAISGCKKKETYTVTFNANGGTGTMVAQIFTEDESQALTRNAFTYDGYTFSGWNTVQGGSGVSYSDQQTIVVTADMTLYAQWTSNGTSPTPTPQPENTLNGHEYVDLGLPSGLLWATCNVGADAPTAYGNYYAWGETTPCGTTYSYSDNPETLPASADAATANWGAGWRMPTKAEFEELNSNCTRSWTTYNGVVGSFFTGPNGKTIFLPAAGFFYNGETYDTGSSGSGKYWTSSYDHDTESFATEFYFNASDTYVTTTSRTSGFPVRPVCQSQN